MRRFTAIAFATLLMCSMRGHAGERVSVSGEVFGKWEAGTALSVVGPTWVPAGASLTIEHGVDILIRTSAPFIIYGGFDAAGTADAPIVVTAPASWQGFRFEANSTYIRYFRHVHVVGDDAPPRFVVTGINSYLRISDCDFQARQSCLSMTGGRIQAERNRFFTHGVFSKAVVLSHLDNIITNPCNPANTHANRFGENNVIRVVVSDPDTIRVSWGTQLTAGLFIEGSTNLCLRGNSIMVIAPGYAIGAYFGETVDEGRPDWQLDRALISVSGTNRWPKGVMNANEGLLRITNCNIDVIRRNPDSPYLSAGITATSGADVVVNNSIVQVDAGENYFEALDGGDLVVDYVYQWGTLGTPAPPRHGRRIEDAAAGQRIEVDGVTYGDHVWTADPQFQLEGVWAQLQSPEDFRNYYALRETSPCIDAGDTLVGADPDGTPPDIGRFYFHQTISSTTDPITLPFSPHLALPYPNPFNSTVVLPLTLNRPGQVRVLAYNLHGQQVAVIADGNHAAGEHRLLFAAENIATGTYIISVEIEGKIAASRSVLLLK